MTEEEVKINLYNYNRLYDAERVLRGIITDETKYAAWGYHSVIYYIPKSEEVNIKLIERIERLEKELDKKKKRKWYNIFNL